MCCKLKGAKEGSRLCRTRASEELFLESATTLFDTISVLTLEAVYAVFVYLVILHKANHTMYSEIFPGSCCVAMPILSPNWHDNDGKLLGKIAFVVSFLGFVIFLRVDFEFSQRVRYSLR